MTGAIGGLAVAAAGGDKDAVRDGFLLSGGMVLIQTGYQKVTNHQIDGRSRGEAYCMATVGAECSPPKDAYIRDASGNIQYDTKGNPLVDVTKTDPLRPHAGTWAKEKDTPLIGVGERSASMTAVSRIPGMNAMAFFHDTWSVSWDMNAFTNVATIVPAVVLTYTGTGAPYFDKLQETGTKDARKDTSAVVSGPSANRLLSCLSEQRPMSFCITAAQEAPWSAGSKSSMAVVSGPSANRLLSCLREQRPMSFCITAASAGS